MSTATKDDNAAGGCFILLLIGGYLLYATHPVIFFTVAACLGLLLVLFLGYTFRTLLKSSEFAAVLLAAAALELLAIALGWQSIVACFLLSATTFASLAILKHDYPEDAQGFRVAIVQNGAELAAILAAVTGVLAVASVFLARFPPDHIFEWSERFATARKGMEQVESLSGRVLVIVGVPCLLFLWSERARRWFGRAWAVGSFGRKWIRRAALVFVIVSSFSFTANHAHGSHPWDGPVDALTKARADALRDYRDLVWKIELRMGRELTLQVVSGTISAMSPPARASLTEEARLYRQSANIPAPYLAVPPVRLPMEQLLKWESPIAAREKQLLEAMPQPSGPPNAYAFPQPPASLTLSAIRAAKREADGLPATTAAPEWMSGVGKEVAQHFFNMALDANRIPFLRMLSADLPLLSELLNVALDAINEDLFEKVHNRAARLATELTGPGGGANRDAGTVDRKLEEAVRELKPRPSLPEPGRIAKLQDGIAERGVRLRSARESLRRDLAPGFTVVESRIAALTAKMQELGVSVPSAESTLGDDFSGSSDPLFLQREIQRYGTCRRVLAEAMSRLPGVRTGAENPRWREVLGDDYPTISRNAQRMFVERANAEQFRLKMEREMREVEQRSREREFRVP